MHVLKLTLVVCCAALCQQHGAVALRRGDQENGGKEDLKIEDVEYSRENTADWAVKEVQQVEEKVTFHLPSSSSKKTEVSVLYFDSEEEVWVQAAFHQEEQQVCFKRNQCQSTVTLRKPLIGYDMLKSGSCSQEEFKQQPYVNRRWGEEEERETDRPQCSMVIVKAGRKSVSQIYPDDDCPKREIDFFQKENRALALADHKRKSRNTFTHSITQFTKARIGNMRKFVCKLAYTHGGYPTSLGNGIPEAEVKVYYKPSNSDGWGSPLLDLDWKKFSNNKNKYESWVSIQQLNSQGVQWNKCFKCEATINEVTERRCRGSCTCN